MNGNELLGYANEVADRYTIQLLNLAQQELDRRIRARVDVEDVVQSAYRTFFRRVADGQYDFEHFGGIWRMLALITLRKCRRWNAHFRTSKANVVREVTAPDDFEESLAKADTTPTPGEVVSALDLLEQLRDHLSSSPRRLRVLDLHLTGCTQRETAEEIGCSEYTVARDLTHIRRQLKVLTAECQRR